MGVLQLASCIRMKNAPCDDKFFGEFAGPFFYYRESALIFLVFLGNLQVSSFIQPVFLLERKEQFYVYVRQASLFLSWWGRLSLEFVITLAKHLIYKKYSYVPPNDLSEMLPLFIDHHCVRNKQAILLCSINSYMLRDHICNAKCTNLECHCTTALGREDLPL